MLATQGICFHQKGTIILSVCSLDVFQHLVEAQVCVLVCCCLACVAGASVVYIARCWETRPLQYASRVLQRCAYYITLATACYAG